MHHDICCFSNYIPWSSIIYRIMYHEDMLLLLLCTMSDVLEVWSSPRPSSLLVHARSLQLFDSSPYQSQLAPCVFSQFLVFCGCPQGGAGVLVRSRVLILSEGWWYLCAFLTRGPFSFMFKNIFLKCWNNLNDSCV